MVREIREQKNGGDKLRGSREDNREVKERESSGEDGIRNEVWKTGYRKLERKLGEVIKKV